MSEVISQLLHLVQNITADKMLLIPTLVSVSIAGILCQQLVSWRRQLPPGPMGWPWLGYTPCLGPSAFDEMQKLQEMYGDIVSFKLFGKTVIILNSLKTIQEAALGHCNKIGRHTLLINDLLANGHGISNYDTERALELRKALLRHLYGSDHMKAYLANQESDEGNPLQLAVEQGIGALTAELHSKADVPISIVSQIRQVVWQIVWKIVFGAPCSMKPEEIDDVLQNISTNNMQNSMFQSGQLLPNFCLQLLRRSDFLRKLFKVDGIISRYEDISRILSQQVDAVQSGGPTEEWSVIHGLLNDEKLRVSGEEIKRLVFELMAAGTDTTTLTLSWACSYLSNRGSDELKGIHIAQHLQQIHRLASVVPLALPHVAREAFTLRGYDIPRGSILIYNIYAVHRVQYSEVESECPGQDAIPFSLGSRSCPGMRMANKVLTDITMALHESFVIEEYSRKTVETGENGKRDSVQLQGLTRGPCTEQFLFHERHF